MISELWTSIAFFAIAVLLASWVACLDCSWFGNLWRRFRRQPLLAQDMKRILVALTVVLLHFGVCADTNALNAVRRQLMLDFMGVIPAETNEYATSDWRSPDDWTMDALFFDLDSDGREEALVSYGDMLQPRADNCWGLVIRNEDGKVLVDDDCPVQGHSWHFMLYEASSLPPLLLHVSTRTNEVDVYYQPRTNKVVAVPLEKGIQHIISRKDFKNFRLWMKFFTVHSV